MELFLASKVVQLTILSSQKCNMPLRLGVCMLKEDFWRRLAWTEGASHPLRMPGFRGGTICRAALKPFHIVSTCSSSWRSPLAAHVYPSSPARPDHSRHRCTVSGFRAHIPSTFPSGWMLWENVLHWGCRPPGNIKPGTFIIVLSCGMHVSFGLCINRWARCIMHRWHPQFGYKCFAGAGWGGSSPALYFPVLVALRPCYHNSKMVIVVLILQS